MRVLVTGSSGQLGAEIARQLSGTSEVIGLDPRPGRWTTVLGAVEQRDLVFRAVEGVDAVVHTASLHAPHVAAQSKGRFIDVNVQGTLNLLEAAAALGVKRFLYTSTTSIYGHALEARDRAVWVSEELFPWPRDIYDVTKQAAEGLCELAHRERGLAVLVLRTSRFFPEEARVMAIHRLYRGVDVRDAAAAHVLALDERAPRWGVYVISARSPFQPSDVEALWADAPAVIRRRCPEVEAEFARRGWALPARIDRVYAIDRAERELGYRPRFNVLEHLTEAPPPR